MSQWTVPGYGELTLLGEGGFGRVVLARHDASNRVVAIKYLHAGDEQARAQFRHEAAILHRVVSPHVARLYDFVETPHGAAIVMEAVPGVSLKELLARHHALPPEAALALLKGSLLGLAAAHAAGAVHRDYKPGNVLVQPNHQSKLVDFGIALLAGHGGHTGGTPAYMAPEQWHGAPATPATDVYAATAVFFLCATGERPFPGGETEQLRQAHQHAPVPVERAPEPVRDLIRRGMAKDVRQRPASAAAFVAELEAAATAGYGRNWESAGWQRLAGFAGALLAASPMAWLVSSTGVLTPAAAGAAGAAGTAGVAGATGVVAKSAVATKVAAAIIGAAVVAGGAVIVVDTVTDPPGGAQEAFAVDTVTERASYPVNVDVSAQVVRVSGSPVADRINAALRAPVDARIRDLRDSIASVRDTLGDDERADELVDVEITSHLRLRNANFLSVRYENQPDVGAISNSSWHSYDTVTVDLRTGRALTPEQVFRPEARTADGLDALEQKLVDHSPEPLCEDPTGGSELDIAADDLGGAILVTFTRDGAEFTVDLPALGHITACGIRTVVIPYADLTDVLDPALARELTAG